MQKGQEDGVPGTRGKAKGKMSGKEDTGENGRGTQDRQGEGNPPTALLAELGSHGDGRSAIGTKGRSDEASIWKWVMTKGLKKGVNQKMIGKLGIVDLRNNDADLLNPGTSRTDLARSEKSEHRGGEV